MKSLLFVFILSVVGFSLLTCGSDVPVVNPTPNPPTTPGPNGEITDEQRLAVLKEASKTVYMIGDLKSDAAQQILLAWIKSRPEFAESGIARGNVWALFTDDRLAIFIPNWEGAGETGGRKAMDFSFGRDDFSTARDGISTGGADVSSAGSHVSTARTEGVPASNKAVILYGLGKAFENDCEYLKNMIKSSHTKYDVSVQDASIENLKAVSNVGMFYIRTHGGVGQYRRNSNDYGFNLWTTDTVSAANERLYQPELNSRMLVYVHAVHDRADTVEWHYGISGEFVRHSRYMNFARDAFLYIDACNGLTPEASRFVSSMMGEAPDSMATYLGWTGPKSSDVGTPTARFIFDRLLGLHDKNVPPEAPVQRPFDWSAVYNDLDHRGLGVSSHGGELGYHSNYATKPILTPSVSYIYVNDFENKLVIYGLFGEDPGPDGKVTVDGVPAANVFWTPTFIMCDIPNSGKGSFGDVKVSVRDNESNTVPLSLWTIPLNVSVDDMGLTTEANLQLKIRADVHPYRLIPGEKPRTVQRDSLEILKDDGNPGWIFNTQSTGTYSVGGERQVTCTVEGCTVRDTESTSNWHAALPYKPFGNDLGFKAFYKWAEDMKTIYVRLTVNIPNVGMDFEAYGKCPDKDAVSINRSYPSTLGVSIPTKDINQLEIKLDDNYNITSGTISKTQYIVWGRCETVGKVIRTATWSQASPNPKPTPNTDARLGQ
ncbi:IPT/TIG domain-containing protein [Chryseolinea sp. T2]|uniref:IPT/TIG domain-containing protein n=1 Tax=Chryseolinea sp. T2 TaxID=3129255 RepID=UPI003078018E